jgi:hypothetical protein
MPMPVAAGCGGKKCLRLCHLPAPRHDMLRPIRKHSRANALIGEIQIETMYVKPYKFLQSPV